MPYPGVVGNLGPPRLGHPGLKVKVHDHVGHAPVQIDCAGMGFEHRAKAVHRADALSAVHVHDHHGRTGAAQGHAAMGLSGFGKELQPVPALQELSVPHQLRDESLVFADQRIVRAQ